MLSITEIHFIMVLILLSDQKHCEFMKEIILDSESLAIQHLCKKDKRLAKAIALVGSLSYSVYADPFSFLVHEIIEQMLSKKAGTSIYKRLDEICNHNISADTISRLSIEDIRSCGTSNSKANYISSLARSVMDGSCNFDYISSLDDHAAMNYLLQLKGIGTWTAKMYLIFVLNRNDILPYEDVAFQQAYKWLYKTEDISKASISKRCKKWSPYTSIGARYMYRLLDEGFTKEPFHLYK